MCCLPVTHMVLLLYRRLQELIWWEVDFMGSWTMDSGRLMSWEVDFVGFDSTLADRIGTRNVQIVFTNACSTLEAYSPLHAVHWRRIHQCMQYTGGICTNACSTLEAYSPMHAVHWRQWRLGNEANQKRLASSLFSALCSTYSRGTSCKCVFPVYMKFEISLTVPYLFCRGMSQMSYTSNNWLYPLYTGLLENSQHISCTQIGSLNFLPCGK